MFGNELSSTAETTWSQALGVGATFTGVTWGTLNAMLKIKDGFFINRRNGDWSGLVLAGIFQHTEHKNQNDQRDNGHDRISVGAVKVEHFIMYTYIFSKVR